jgi:hypothetical protein
MTFAGSIASTMAHYALPYALQNTSLASYTTVQYFNKLSVPTVTGSIYYAYIVRSISTSSANVFVSVNDVLKKECVLSAGAFSGKLSFDEPVNQGDTISIRITSGNASNVQYLITLLLKGKI